MFKKKFDSSKCKTLLRLAMSRIKLLRNKRELQLQQMKKELAALLQSARDPSARIRVEHVIREQNTMVAYDIIELFCELLVTRLPIIESQKQCPQDLKEAVGSLIFAASRCADIPELLDIKKVFGHKYGKEFVAAAAELRPDCSVNRTIIEKLSARAPGGELKLKHMKEIAKEYLVDWDSKECEEELLKQPEDLLKGPRNFSLARRVSAGFEEEISQRSPGQHQNIYQDRRNSSPGMDDMNSANSQGLYDSNHMPRSQTFASCGYEDGSPGYYNSTPQMRRSISGLSSVSLSRNENKKTFGDAQHAAQVAGESAQQAIHAAQAAASLARQNNSNLSQEETYLNSMPLNEKVSRAQAENKCFSEYGFSHCPQRASQGIHQGTNKVKIEQYGRQNGLQGFGDEDEFLNHFQNGRHNQGRRTSSGKDSSFRQQGNSRASYWNDHMAHYSDEDVNRYTSPAFDESDDANSETDSEINQRHFGAQIGDAYHSHCGSNPFPAAEEPTYSRRDSIKSSASSHVHPKLPDYDELTARLELLKYRK